MHDGSGATSVSDLTLIDVNTPQVSVVQEIKQYAVVPASIRVVVLAKPQCGLEKWASVELQAKPG